MAISSVQKSDVESDEWRGRSFSRPFQGLPKRVQGSLELHTHVDACAVALEFLPAQPGVEALEAEHDVVVQPVVDPEIDPVSGPQTDLTLLLQSSCATGRVGCHEPTAGTNGFRRILEPS